MNACSQRPSLKRTMQSPAAPPSLCISMTVGTAPQMFLRPSSSTGSAHSPIGEAGVMG